jgi:hypothetical protein
MIMSTQLSKNLEEKKKNSEIKLDTPIGKIVIDKKELEKKLGKFTIITLIIILTIIMMILKSNIVISQTFQALNIV